MEKTIDGICVEIFGEGSMGDFTSSNASPWGTAINKAVIQNGVVSIGAYAFRACTVLSEVYIPKSVTRIGDNAFLYCTSLEKMYYAGTEDDWKKVLIGSGNTNLTNATIEYALCDHVYDNDCDNKCNICGYIRQVGDHIYDNDCDAVCNECGHVREVAPHQYDNACDDTCNICGHRRDVAPHNFDADGYCTECGCPKLIALRIETVDANFGVCCVEVRIYIPYAPSWSAVGFNLLFDASELIFKSFDLNPALIEQALRGEPNIHTIRKTDAGGGIVSVSFASAVVHGDIEGYYPVDSEGNAYSYLGTFKFDIAEGFTGFADISASVTVSDCVRNGNIIKLDAEVENGGINVLPKKLGDPDGDGEITVTDALAALRVAAKLSEVTPELLATCDVDKDGEITVTDALAILRVAAKLTDKF